MYDIIVIGAGPAGITAGIYAKEANKSILILDKVGFGGQVANLFKVTNFPAFESIEGFELCQKMKNQAEKLGVVFKREEVVSVDLDKEEKIIKTHNNTYTCKAVILATGAYAKPLEVENEKYYLGKGLSYCATCDGNFFQNKTVAVVGGGNSGIDDALYLSNLADKVYLIHRREVFTANESAFDKVKALVETGKIEILTNTVVNKINGQDKIENIEIYDKKANKTETLNVDGLFVAIGRKPDTEMLSSQIKLDDKGFIQTDEYMRTNLKNVFAVGDVRNTPLRQIVTACADGAVAVSAIIRGL